MNECLLLNQSLEPGYPQKVSIETARRWLHHLGFSVINAKKGTYIDGHERKDVVQYREKFLWKMTALGFLNKDNAPTIEAVNALPRDLESPSHEQLEKTIVLCHDETTFQANDYARTQWGTKDDHMLVPKSKGAGIIVSFHFRGRWILAAPGVFQSSNNIKAVWTRVNRIWGKQGWLLDIR